MNHVVALVEPNFYGVDFARYQIIKSYAEALTAIQYIKYPAVIKPTNAASSQGVYLVQGT